MGFKDEYQDTSGASFIGSEEKAELIKDGTPLKVNTVSLVPNGGFKGKGDAYYVSVELDGEDRMLSFTTESVQSRDRLFAQLSAYLEREDAEDAYVALSKAGQAILVEAVDAPE